MTLDDILLEAEEKMIKTEQVLVNDFAGVRTGKAAPALVEEAVARSVRRFFASSAETSSAFSRLRAGPFPGTPPMQRRSRTDEH